VPGEILSYGPKNCRRSVSHSRDFSFGVWQNRSGKRRANENEVTIAQFGGGGLGSRFERADVID